MTDLLLDGDVVVLLPDLLDTDPVGLPVTDLLIDSEDTLLLDTDLLPDGDDVLTDLLLDSEETLLLGDDVSTFLLVDLDSEETLLLGDDVSTLLVVTVLSGVEPEFLLVIPFTCRLGLNSSTLLGLGLCGGFTTAVRGRCLQS